MSFLQLINQIDPDKFEKEARDKFLNRKEALGKMSNWSKKLALSAVPLGALAAFSEPAIAQSNGEPISTLQYALTLELLESSFYTKAKNMGTYSGTDYAATFDEIQANEAAHVNFLQDAISTAGANPVSGLTFDFTLGGQYDPFGNQAQFLLFAQAFEDTGVRAYKGQAGDLMGTPYLTPALQIHSVEARHASAVRRIRGIQGWIPGVQDDIIAAFQPTYLGDDLQEDNTVHLGYDVTNLVDQSSIQVSEAWDEPLSASYVVNYVDPFITSND